MHSIVSKRRLKTLSLIASARFLFVSSIRLFSSRSSHPAVNLNMQQERIKSLQIGLTGSIGMGKSTISNQLIKLGFPLFDADKEVHRLYSPNGGAVRPIETIFPEAVVDGAVDRSKLTSIIMKDPSALRTIEQIVHPLVVAERIKYYEDACADGKPLVFYDIPLLFESLSKYNVDYIMVATANADVQRQRVLDRPGMTEEKFQAILQKQVPDSVKREKADFLVHTDYPTYFEAKAQLGKIIETIIEKNPALWEQWKRGMHLVEPPEGTISRQLSRSMSMSSAAQAAFDLVLFDLDDTLVPTAVHIKAATDRLHAFMAQKMPLTNQAVDTRLKPLMQKYRVEHPLIAQDFHELRRRATLELATEFGEEQHVDEALEIFLQARSDVSQNVYSDAIECLEWFHSLGIKIGILTNGSAELSRCPLLSKYMCLSLTAGEVGVLKPSPVGFLACSQLSGVPPNRILFVGDNYQCDVLGANNAGMVSAMLHRKDFNERSVTDETVLAPEDVQAAHRDSFPEAHMVLPSLRVADLESTIHKYLRS